MHTTVFRRIPALLLALILAVSLFPTAVLAAPKETPIGTAQELAAWDGTGSAYLTQNIDLTGIQWVTSKEIATNAVLDGRGHQITGIALTTGVDDGYGAKYYGLYTNLSGTVKNLGLVGTVTTAETEGTIRAGLLAAAAANNYSNVLNCYAIGSVTAPNYVDQTSTKLRLGGLIGAYSNGTIQNCYSAVAGGPLTGSVPMMNSPTDSYYDSSLFVGTNPEEFGGCTTPKTTAEMQSQAFVDLLNKNKDFTGTENGQQSNEGNEWGVTEGGYPIHIPFREKVLVELTDEAGLRAVANDLSGKYLLKNDIALTAPWVPLGITGKPFKGTFDGGGHTISGMDVDAKLGSADPDDDNQRGAGLFGCSTGTIKNVGVIGTVASDKYYDRLGGIVGRNKGTVENCFAKVTLVSKVANNKAYAAGGIAGENMTDGSISNCYSVSTSGEGIANKYGCIGAAGGTISNVFYDNTVYPFTDKWDRHKTTGKGTAELQSSVFAKLLNAGRGENLQWMMRPDNYPIYGTDPIPEAPALAGTVAIAGTPKVGETLTAAFTDVLTTDGLSYRWVLTQNGKERTVGGNENTYIPAISEVGGTVTLQVTSALQSGKLESAPSAAVAENEKDTSAARAEKAAKLHNSIAFSFLDSSEPWSILEMVAAGQKANLTGIDKFMQESAAVFRNSKLQATEDEKYIIALSALGIDAANMPLGNERVDGVSAMAAKNLDGTNILIFALPAYDSGNYTVPQNATLKRAQIVTELLDRQTAQGDWTLSGTGADPDMTAMAIHGLAPLYCAPLGTYPGVSPQLQQQAIDAVDLAVARLSSLQIAEKIYGKDYRGGFKNQDGKANANSASMVICALSALGINPDTDCRFIKNGRSALDGLLAFSLNDGSGFGFKDNKTKDNMATEQGFRALLCCKGIAATGAPYNIYKLGAVTPTPPPTKPDVPDGKPEEPAKKITASIRIVGDTLHTESHTKYVNWLQTQRFTLDEGSTVYDLFLQAIASGGLAQKGAEKNYVQAIKAPQGYGDFYLSEFDNGPKSGWMYLVNNSYPDVGLQAQVLKNGDAVVWHYVDDYTTERGAGKWKEAKDDAPPTVSAPKPSEKPTENQGTIQPTVTADKNGSAAVTVSKKDADKALEAVKKNGSTALVISPDVKGDAQKVAVTLPKTAVSDLASGTKAALTVESKIAKISLSTGALSTIAAEKGSDVSVTAQRISNDQMSEENKALVGDHPVYDFSVTVGTAAVHKFGGAVTVTLPYTPKEGEDTRKITVFYIDENGKAAEMTGAKYDPATKSITFETDHFSTFAVAYNEKKAVFTDVNPEDWFFDAVNFATEKGLFSGTTDKTFSPQTDMTRSMLWTVLYRLSGEKAAKNVTDAPQNDSAIWYAEGQSWAISTGISDGLHPEENVTRQELAAMLYRYVKGTKVTADLSQFTDADAVAPWAADAVNWAVTARLLTGRSDTVLDPAGTARRCEVAAMLQRLDALKMEVKP